jgi:glycosyltransferase involved in cell wall biosynthesis
MIANYLFIILLSGLFIAFGIRLERTLRKSQIRKSYNTTVDSPSVSVCIPARNETHAMTECLERVMASDYRKLEVIVFDDESADNTSAIINSFAHEGVRFVPGTSLPDGWLGKNHALEVLAREASGTYVVFLDVDTRITSTTISQLVGYATTEGLQMVSVIPGRNDIWRPNVLFGHLRYYWELILSRASAPATSSSLWMIKRHTLLDTIGGFAPHKAQVEPEKSLAAIIGFRAYRCLVNGPLLGVSYEKKWLSQYETSRRLLYPMVGGTKVSGALGLATLVLLNAPLVVIITGLIGQWTAECWVALIYLGLFALLYGRYTHVIWRMNWWIGILAWPYVVLQELILFIFSIVGYASGTITWKGRPVLSPKQAEQSRAAQTNS